jgi:hypothetical protein
MDADEIKIKCLEVASTGDSRGTLARAQEYYEWITQEPKKPRGRKATRSNLESKEASGA